MRLLFNFTLFASSILSLDGSCHRELSLSFDIQLLLALGSSFLCLFLCNECSSVCSASLCKQASMCLSPSDLLFSDHCGSATCSKSCSFCGNSSCSSSSSCFSACYNYSLASPCSQNSLLTNCTHTSSADSTGPLNSNSSCSSLPLKDISSTFSLTTSDQHNSTAFHCLLTLFDQFCLCFFTWTAPKEPIP